MATPVITDYTSLQTTAADFLGRDDLAVQVPAFISLAEARLRRKLRRKVVRTSYLLNAAEITLPSDCAELRHIRIDDPTWQGNLQPMTQQSLADYRARHGTTGVPKVYAVTAGIIQLIPAPDQSYNGEITYFQQLPSLSAGATINWLVTEAPDVYLYATLLMAEKYLEHDERVPLWKDGLEEGIAELNTALEREELGAQPLPMRLPVTFG